MKLFFNQIEAEAFNKRGFNDRRKKVNYLIVSYFDLNNIEYRKKFEFPVEYSYKQMKEKLPREISN